MESLIVQVNNSKPELDWTQRYSDFLIGNKSRQERIVYQRDRARVIHSASFRRLQAKTQIFGLNESDFYRTRLTHSMEVAQIGSGLVEQLITVGEGQNHLNWLPSFYLIESICLAHDLGHPPFGHGGEIALNYMMRKYGGFEGNAQTLRILSRLGEYTTNNGIDLSRRATLGVLKYPAIYDDIIKKTPQYLEKIKQKDVTDFKTLNMQQWQPPKSIYNDEKIIFDWVLALFSEQDRAKFIELKASEQGFYKTQHKSLDTTLMEVADDIAYGVHDLEDAVAIGVLPKDLWQKKVIEHKVFQRHKLWEDEINNRLFSGRAKGRKHAISKIVGIMIESVKIIEKESFEHPLLRYQATLGKAEAEVLELLKSFIYENVITLPEVKGMEYKGQLIVLDLFKSLRANPQALLPRNTYEKFKYATNQRDKYRIISDYISGMTNTYASRLYEKLFTASQGSIFDRL